MKKSTKIIIAIISFLLCVAIGIGGIIIFGNPQNSQEDIDYTIQPGDLFYGIRHLEDVTYAEVFAVLNDIEATVEINNEKKAFIVFNNKLGLKKETSFKKGIKDAEKIIRAMPKDEIEKTFQRCQKMDSWNQAFGKEDASKIMNDPWFIHSCMASSDSGIPIDEVYAYVQTEKGKIQLIYWLIFRQEVGVADYEASPNSPLYGVPNISKKESISYLADEGIAEDIIYNADGSVILYTGGEYLYLSKEKTVNLLNDVMVMSFKEKDFYKNEDVAFEVVKELQKDHPNIVLPTKENANKLATDEWYWLSLMCGMSSGVPVDEIYNYTQTDVGKYEALVFVYFGQEFGSPKNSKGSNIPEIK